MAAWRRRLPLGGAGAPTTALRPPWTRRPRRLGCAAMIYGRGAATWEPLRRQHSRSFSGVGNVDAVGGGQSGCARLQTSLQRASAHFARTARSGALTAARRRSVRQTLSPGTVAGAASHRASCPVAGAAAVTVVHWRRDRLLSRLLTATAARGFSHSVHCLSDETTILLLKHACVCSRAFKQTTGS
jgi:hypothetical protein